MRNIDALPRLSLGSLPTPLHEAQRLGAALGLANFLIKRDDLTGLALGGNKARKLEYVMADVKASGADVVITSTGPQSNRARMTAAACRKVGVDCILLFAGDYGVNKPIGNIMLDEVFGAEMRSIEAPDPSSPEALDEAKRIAESLRRTGRRPYLTEVGGVPEPLSDVGYFTGGCELIEQCRMRGTEPRTVLLATGSGGTHAGMLVALRAAGCHARVIGIPTDPGAAVRAARVRKHVASLIEWLEIAITIPGSDIIVEDGFSGAGHGPPDDASLAAVRLAARTEGMLIDPIYVGKIVAALPTLVRRGLVDPKGPTIMVNTGGVVSVFMYSESFARTVTDTANAA